MQSRYYPHVRKIILNSELLREVELNKLQLQLMSKHNEIKQDEEVIDTFMKSLDDENDSFVLGLQLAVTQLVSRFKVGPL